MQIVRKFVDGRMEEAYLIDDAGNEIRGIVASDNSSVVELEVFEGNFDLLLTLTPHNEMTYFTREAMGELTSLILASREVAKEDALLFVSMGIDRILRKQASSAGKVRVQNAAAQQSDQEWLG